MLFATRHKLALTKPGDALIAMATKKVRLESLMV